METIYKVVIYVLVFLLVFYSLDSINTNGIFKKNSEAKAKLLYMLIGISISYLVVHFIYDFF